MYEKKCDRAHVCEKLLVILRHAIWKRNFSFASGIVNC